MSFAFILLHSTKKILNLDNLLTTEAIENALVEDIYTTKEGAYEKMKSLAVGKRSKVKKGEGSHILLYLDLSTEEFDQLRDKLDRRFDTKKPEKLTIPLDKISFARVSSPSGHAVFQITNKKSELKHFKLFDNDSNSKTISTPSPQAILENLKCPFTDEKMKEPVVAADGYSYEKTANAKVVKTNNAASPPKAKPSQKANADKAQVQKNINLAIHCLQDEKYVQNLPDDQFIGLVHDNINIAVVQNMLKTNKHLSHRLVTVFNSLMANPNLAIQKKFQNKKLFNLASDLKIKADAEARNNGLTGAETTSQGAGNDFKIKASDQASASSSTQSPNTEVNYGPISRFDNLSNEKFIAEIGLYGKQPNFINIFKTNPTLMERIEKIVSNTQKNQEAFFPRLFAFALEVERSKAAPNSTYAAIQQELPSNGGGAGASSSTQTKDPIYFGQNPDSIFYKNFQTLAKQHTQAEINRADALMAKDKADALANETSPIMTLTEIREAREQRLKAMNKQPEPKVALHSPIRAILKFFFCCIRPQVEEVNEVPVPPPRASQSK